MDLRVNVLLICLSNMLKKAFKRFGHKVKYWFAFNEPVVVQTRIHLDALRYPFYQDSKAWMQWNYNKALATNMIMKVYKEGGYRIAGGKFGTIINVKQLIQEEILLVI